MSKATTKGALTVDKRPDSGHIAKFPESGDLALLFGERHAEYATEVGVNCELPADVLVGMASQAVNAAKKLEVGAGLVLLKAKSACAHGEFAAYLASVQIPQQRASELMVVADVLAKAQPEDRKRLLGQPKTALIGLARMDDQLRQAFLATGELDERLTLAEYAAALKKLQAERETLEARLETMQNAAERAQAARALGLADADLLPPPELQEIRQEAVALSAQASEALRGLRDLLVPIGAHDDDAAEWAEATRRHVFEALSGLLFGAAAHVQALVDEGLTLGADMPTVLDKVYLQPVEAERAARRYADVMAMHRKTAENRAIDRANARGGRGRPRAKVA